MMKKFMAKKLAVLLAVLMMFSGFPFSILAAEAEPAENEIVTEVTADVAATDAVCQIGETTYASLADAVNAVASGDTIKLLTDVYECVTLLTLKMLP